MRLSTLSNKKVAIWGAGQEGLSMLRLLGEYLSDQRVDVFDEGNNIDAIKLATDYPALGKLKNNVNIECLLHYDIIIKSPGISIYRPEIVDAKAKGVIFTSVTNLWFAAHPEAKTICVTGTKGKSTTTALIAHALKAQGLKVQLAGNMGIPLADLWRSDAQVDVWVLELSSYQTCDFTGTPSIVVLLNLYPEHLDWHLSSSNYFNDKLQLIRQLDDKGTLVLNADSLDYQQLAFLYPHARVTLANSSDTIHHQQNAFFEGDQHLFSSDDLQILGEHNFANTCMALTVLKVLGFRPEDSHAAVRDFLPLAHRLQPVETINGVLYVNDSISTTPESTIAALKVFVDRPITLIVGGYDRGLSYHELARYLQNFPIHTLIALPDNGQRILDEIETLVQASNNQMYSVDNLQQAMSIAKRVTPTGGVVLLSPAAPSYGHFMNYQVRGRVFSELVMQ